jgi:LPS O-antigen subunit length determinant protein (WzzB/FepE family)
VRHLEQQYDNSLRNIGVGHKHAAQQVHAGFVEVFKYYSDASAECFIAKYEYVNQNYCF